MKISVNDNEIFTLTETQKKVICNDITDDIFDEDMKRRLQYILMHKYERCMMRLKSEWLPKLKGRLEFIPLGDEQLAEVIFSQPDYKSRTVRENESLNR